MQLQNRQSILYYFSSITENTNIWRNIDPHLLMFIFIPPLVFESSINADFHIFRKSISQVFILLILDFNFSRSWCCYNINSCCSICKICISI